MTKPVNDKISRALESESQKIDQASYDVRRAGKAANTQDAAKRLKEAKKVFEKSIDTIDDIVKVLDEG